MKLYRCTMRVCEACLDGEGQECHTPGCALWLHRVDLPIDRELLEECAFSSEVDAGEEPTNAKNQR